MNWKSNIIDLNMEDDAQAIEQGIEQERELFQLIRTRRGKLGFLTRKHNEIETCIRAGESKEVVTGNMETFNHHLEEFMELQVSVQSLLNEDEREADHT